uniref:tetrahydrofolate dehydrogenase/cyclohydrolase catalytic domain-containing protein n=1 Tax=Acinetobacter junii TaxID=40215 RepID=UPI001D18194A
EADPKDWHLRQGGQRVQIIKKEPGKPAKLQFGTEIFASQDKSATYVRMKGNACRRVGMDSLKVELPKETTTEQLLAEIEKLNA